MNRLLFGLLICISLHALPSGEEVKAGEATFHADEKGLSIRVSDKAIIDYQGFDIGSGERVEFIQPGENSAVLNRVVGGGESKILGELRGNGRVFLVNPEGIYFGKDAVINAGSFVATSLAIRDEDFLNDRFEFVSDGLGSVINEGLIQADGFVALFAPHVENRGTIFARVEKVFIGSAEKVAIDLMGDGLIQFRIDGDLERALIENYGKIESANGSVQISLKAARKAIQSVLNTDGLEIAAGIEEVDGVIRLLSGSEIRAKQVEVIGERVELRGASIDASREGGGGSVFIGGEYQGEGDRNAITTIIDEQSIIYADAIGRGDGGKVIVWSDSTTLFDGKIYARGEKGGFVETSGKQNLGIEFGYVNTAGANGTFGNWLLDPAAITIANAGGGTIAQGSSPNCSLGGNVNISVATMQAAATNIALCAQNTAGSTITVNNAFTLASGVSLSMTAGSGNAGTIRFNANVTTRGQPITLTGLFVIGANVRIDTTNGGANPAGGNISFSNTINGNGARTLTLNGGTGGTITMTGAVGGTTALTSLTATGATITQSSTARTTGIISYTGSSAINVGGDMTTTANTITLTGPVIISNTPTFTTSGANISFLNTLDGATTATFIAGAGNVSFSGAVGGTAPPTDLIFTSASLIQIGANVTVSGANPLTFGSAVSLTGTSTITSNNANISFSSTLNGTQNLTIAGGSGTTTFSGVVGGATALSSLAVTAATINVTGNITTAGGAIGLTGAVAITNTPTLDSTNAGGAAAGANISFSDGLSGATALTLRAGSVGNVSFGGVVSGLTNLTFTSAALIQIGNNITVTGANPLTFPSPVSFTGTSTITSNNANIGFSSTVNGAQAVTIAGGSGTTTFFGAIGGTAPLGSLSVTAATLTQSLTAQTTGALSYTGSTAININGNVTTSGSAITLTGPVAITGTPIFTTAGANISFSSTLNGSTTATFVAGSGNVSFTGIVGGIAPLTNLTFTSAALIQIGNNITVTGANPLTFSSPVSFTGTSTITSNNANIGFSSTVNGAQAVTIAGGNGITTFTGAVGGTSALSSLTVTAATISQNSTSRAVGAISYTGSTQINLSNSITSTTPSAILLTGPILLLGDVIVTGSDITLSSTVDGAFLLNLQGTGTVLMSGAIGVVTPLTSLTANGTTITQSASAKSTGAISYTGAISLGGNVTTAGGTIGMTGAVTLGANVIVDATNSNATPTGAAITFSSTIDNGNTLQIIGGTGGTVTMTGAVGGGTALTSLTVSGATIHQSSSARTTGIISYTAPTAINVSGNMTTTANAITLTGPVTLANTPIFTTTGANISFLSTLGGATTATFVAGTGNVSFTGAVSGLTSLTFTSAALIQIGNNITVTSALTFPSPVSFTGTSTITSTNTNIGFNSTVNGGQAVIIAGGSGAVTFTGAVGGVIPLTSLNVTGSTITQSSTAATSGSLNYTGAISLSGNITTSGGTIGMTGAVTLASNIVIDATNSNVAPVGANISFSSTINGSGSRTLTLTGGTGGTVLMTGSVGNSTALNTLTVTGSTITQSSSVVTTGAISYTAPTAINLGGGLSTSGTVGVTGPVLLTGAVAISGSNLSFSSTINNGQTLSLTGTGTITMSGAVGGITPLTSLTVVNGTTVTQSSTVRTTGAISYTGTSIVLNGNLTGDAIGMSGAVTLSGDVVANGSTISFSNTINGAKNLTLTGSSTVGMTGAIGGVTPLASLTVSGTTITESSTVVTTGAISYTGTGITLNGNLTTSGGTIGMTGPVTIIAPITADTTSGVATGANVSFSNTVNGAFDLNLNGGTNGVITLTGALGGTSALNSLTISGATITQSSSSRATGAISYTAPTVINLGGDVTSVTPSTVVMSGPIFLTGNTVISGSNITLSNTVNGSKTLSLQGTGTVLMSGVIGNVTQITSLTVNGTTITQNAVVQTTGAISYTGAINLNANLATVGSAIGMTGAVTLTSDVVATGSTLSFSSTINGAKNLTLTGSSTVTMTGALGGSTALTSLTVSGTTITQSSTVVTTGAIGYSGTSIRLNGNLTTSGGTIGMTGPVTLLTGLTADTTSSAPAGANLSFSSTVDGGFGFILKGGTGGVVTLSGALGNGTQLSALTVSGASIIQTGAISVANAVSLNGVISLGNNITSTNSSITLTGNVTRTNINNVTLSSNGNIAFTGTINGDIAGRNITLTSASGDVTIVGPMGGLVVLNDFIVSGVNISIPNRGTSTSITTGITTITATGAITFTGTSMGTRSATYTAGTNFNFTAGSPITLTTDGFPITFVTGTIVLSAGTDFNVNTNGGNVTLSNLTGVNRNITVDAASGTVNLAQIGTSGNNVQSVTVTGGVINHPDPIFSNTAPVFNSPTVLTITTNQTGPVVYGSPVVIGADNLIFSGGAFTFNSTLNADSASNSRNITINPGAGNSVSFLGFVGNSAPLTSITIGTAQNVTFNRGVSLGAFTQTGGSGTTTISGGFATTGSGGMSIATNSVTIAGNVSTSNGGALVLNNSGTFTSNGTAYSLGGPFQQTGSGATSLIGGNIQTIDKLVSFAGPLSLTSDFTINTVSTTGASITLSNIVSGAHNLSLTGTTVTMSSAVNVTSLVASGSTITQGSSVTTTGLVSYTGAVNLGGNVTSSGSTIAMTGAVTLTGDLQLSGTTITLSSSVTGAHALTILGNATLSGALSGLTSLTVNGTSIVQGSSSQASGAISYTGNISLGGNVSAGTTVGLSGPVTLTNNVIATGSNISLSNTVNGIFGLTLTGSGTVTMTGDIGGVDALTSLTVSGTTVTQSSSATVSGGISYTGSSGIVLNGNVTTNGGSVGCIGAVTLSAPIAIDTTHGGGTPAGGNITFSSTVNGTQNLTLVSGLANILASGVIGGVNPLGSITISSANNVTATTLSANSFNQVAGSGTTTLNGAVTLSGALGFVFTGSNLSVNNSLSTTSGGPATVSVSGTFALGLSGALSLDGAFTQSGTGMTQSSGSITTTNDLIQFNGVLVLISNTTLSTGSGAGNIVFGSRVSGPGGLNLTAGTGNITFATDIGGSTRLGNLTIVSVGDLTSRAITATTITQTNGSGTSTFNGNLNTSGAGGIHKTGNNFVRNGSLVTTNGGPLVINNSGTLQVISGATTTISGSYSQTGSGPVSISGSETATGISFAGPITLNGNFSLNSNNGNISLATVNATTAGVETLTLTAGTGVISASGAIGGTIRVGVLTVNSCSAMTVQALTASSVNITQTAIDLVNDKLTLGGNLNTNAVQGIVFNVTNLVRNGSITATNGGPLNTTFSGTITGTSLSPIQVGSLHTTNTGSNVLNFQGSVITDTGGITYDTPLNLVGTSTFNTSAVNANIVFNYPINGAQSLTVNAGSGNITFAGVLGGTSRLGDLTISNVNNLNTLSITAATITQTTGSGTSTFNGNINTNGAGGIHMTGVNFVRNGTLTTTNGGSVVINNSGSFQVSAAATTNVSGSYSQTGSGAASTGGSITATGILFAGPLTLNANTAMTSNNGNISFTTIDATTSGVEILTLTAGTGTISVSGSIGGVTRLGSLTVSSCSAMSVQSVIAASVNITQTAIDLINDKLTLGGDLNTNAPAGVVFNVTNLVRNGAITATNGGPLNTTFTGTITGATSSPIQVGSLHTTNNGAGILNFQGSVITDTGGITYDSPLNLIGTSTFNTSASGGDIIFNNPIKGTQTLNLVAGVGNIQLNSTVGNTTPLGSFLITSATNVTTNAVSSGSISISGVTGLVTFGGALTTTGGSGIVLSANQIAVNAGITTTGGGPLTIALTGTSPLTIGNGVTISLDGLFSQTGTGSVSIGGSITTTNDNISFASAVTLTNDVALNTGAGAGDITFSVNLNGAYGLTVAAGTGNINFSGTVGTLTPLTSLSILSGTNLTISKSDVNGTFSSIVSGLTTISEGVITTAIGGITIHTDTFSIPGTLTTTNSGPITIVNIGAGVISGIVSSSSTFTQGGGGAISLGSNVSTAGTLQFGSGITLLGAVAMSSGGNAINLIGTVDGKFDLSFTAGAGAITLSGALGSSSALDTLSIVSGSNVTTGAINATEIIQSAGTGLTHFSGALSTTGSAGISLSGTRFQIDSGVTTTNSGPVSMAHTDLLTIGSTASFSIDGPFTESGGGPVSLGGNLTTTSDTMNWAGAITLTHDVTMDTGSGAGNIIFSNTITGPYCLTLTTGLGTTQFGGALSTNCLSVTAGTILQAASLTTTSTVALTGLVNLGANITTTNSDITITGNVTRTTTNNVTLSTGAGAGDIHITGTIDGNAVGRNLTLTAGTGSVTLEGAIGSVSPLTTLFISGVNATLANFGTTSSATIGNLTINVTGSANFSGTTYAGGTQSYTAGTAFNYTAGALTTVASGGGSITYNTGTIALATGTDFTVDSNGGNVTLSNLTGPSQILIVDASSGTVTVHDIGTAIDPLTSIDITAGTLNNLGTSYPAITYHSPTIITITTNQSGPITYASPVLIGADNLLFSGGAFIFGSTVNSDGLGNTNVTINPGAGNSVTFSGLVGNVTPLTSLTIGAGENVTISSEMIVGSFAQASGTGTTTISGGMDTNAGGISIETANISISGGVTTTNNAPLIFNNLGTLTINGAVFELDGAFEQIGSGGILASGNIQTTDDIVSFNGALTLTGNLSVNTVSSSGAAVTFGSTVDGPYDLDLAAGGGTLTFTGTVGGGARVGNVTIESAGDANIGTINAAALTQVSGSGTTTFGGAVNTNALNGIHLTGNAFAINSSMTTSASGPIAIANSGTLTFGASALLSVGGAFTQTQSGLVNLGGTIAANGSIFFTSGITLTNPAILNTSANGTNITLSSTVNGPSSIEFNLGSGGNLLISGNVGGVTRIGAFLVDNAGNVTTQNITATTITQTTGSKTTTLGALNTSLAGGISLIGNIFSINGNIITGALGPVAIVNSGTLTLAGGSGTSITGSFTQSGGGGVSLSGTLLTINRPILFTNPITLVGAAAISSSSGAGNITFSSTINGAQSLTITAGTGNLLFSSSVGVLNRLGAFQVVSGADITYQELRASTITQSASSGTTLISGPLNALASGGISITGGVITQNGTLVTANNGPIVIANSGTFTQGASIQADGGFTQSGTGAVSLNGSITTTNDAILVNGAVTLAGATLLNTGGGSNIHFVGTINGGNNLTFTAGTGTIILESAVGGGTRIGTLTINSVGTMSTGDIKAGSINQLGGSGTTTLGGTIDANGSGGISLTGSGFGINGAVTTASTGSFSVNNSGAISFGSSANLNIAGAFTQTGTGSVLLQGTITAAGISVAGPASIVSSGSVSLVTSASPITLFNTLDGPGNITFNSGSSSTSLQAAAGSLTRLGIVTFSQASNVATLGIKSGSITQSTGSGTTTISGDLDTNGTSGIHLTGTNFTITGSIVTTNSGPCAIAHTGLLSVVAGSSTLLAGPFTESGSGGTVHLSGTIHASNANVTFANPITLTETATLNSNGGGDILISSTIDGPYDLIYTAGTGNITLAGIIGGTTPVLSLTITTAANVSTSAISAGSITQNAGSGLSTFGALTTTLPAGISVTGTAFTFNGAVSTTGGGGISINNSGALTLSSSAPLTLTGAFSQTDTGAVSLATSIESNGSQILFTGPITLTGSSFLDMDGGGTITLLSTVDGNYNLVIEGISGLIDLEGIVGGSTPLSTFQILAGTNFTSKAINASVIDIEGLAGLATFNGALATTGASGITLSGVAFTLNGNVTTSGGGPLAITNSSTLTILPSLTLSLSGPFTQSGSGVTNMGGTLTTSGHNITFSGPLDLTGDLIFNSGNGNVTLGSDLDGAHSMTIFAGSGDVIMPVAFSIEVPLINFTVASAHDIVLHGIGSTTVFMSGTLSLTATNTISMEGQLYAAHNQYYSSGGDLDFINPGDVTLLADGGSITFASAEAHLNDATNLFVETNGGEFSFEAIHGTNFENLTIDTGSGLASMGSLPNIGSINTVTVTAGSILLNGPMDLENISLTSDNSILNAGAPVEIDSVNNAFFNAVNGNDGSLSSPIFVITAGEIVAGGVDLAVFEGSSVDNTVHAYASNPPCVIYFNGVKIKDCRPPTPPSPSPSQSVQSELKGSRFFAFAYVFDSQFNLASDYFFLTYFLDDSFIKKPIPIFGS